ncbi:claudin-10 isoform X2 [Salmo trutta]|uniref:claudin-10 isoform X2 n=1 Tax=Salmo trutta TaxID=8032 RepID=UPI0006B8320A|nr:claudin-10-like isoform X2 [Salmo trutta]|eukprot:XP_014007107.1 PREDICTED: claudin-10A isoform X1 [Salmo salar]
MKHRTVMMYMEIGCFVSCLAGWILVSSTLAIEYWTWSEVGSVVLTTGNYFSNLWKDCVSDSTGVSDCKEYPSMLGLPVLTLIGMKCTKIGGSELANARVTFAGGITYLASGFAGLIVYSWWGNKVRSEFVDPNFKAQKFEIGAAVFIGWGGSILLITGGFVLSFFSGKEGLRSTSKKRPRRPNSYATARTRRTYMMPNSSRVTPMPQLVQGSRGGRKIRKTRTTGTYSRDDFV